MSGVVSDMWRGNPIALVGGVWLYVDTGEAVAEDKDRDCGFCGKANTPDGHDGCIGELPGVMNACCGHGCAGDAYVQFDDGRRLSGDAARGWMLAAVCGVGDYTRARELISLLQRSRRSRR